MSAPAMAEPPSPPPNSGAALLASDANPDGWALDALLAQIRTEFQRQLQALDPRDAKVRDRLLGYHQVIAALWGSERPLSHAGPAPKWALTTTPEADAAPPRSPPNKLRIVARSRAQSHTSLLSNSPMPVTPGAPARLHLLTTTAATSMQVRKA